MINLDDRIKMIDNKHTELAVSKQCKLLSINRSRIYYKPREEHEINLAIMEKLDKLYFKAPFYGVKKLTTWLKEEGFTVNKKRVRRLMKLMDWRTIYREPKTTIPTKGSYKYPYLLRGLEIVRKNQVWQMDITYIPMRKGFMYLTAIIDVFSRKVVNWSVSNSMEAAWCVDVAKCAFEKHGKPEIFNTDQGSQFTSEAFTSLLIDNDVAQSMDGKGRALDNIYIERLWRSVKYENIYLNVYENGIDLYTGLTEYFDFYNMQRFHESLDNKTPEYVYNRAA